MEFSTPDNDLLDLLRIYQNPSIPTKTEEKTITLPDVNLDDDGSELNKFTIKLYIESIAAEQAIIKEMRTIVSSAPDPDLANSLASLEKSVGDKMKMLAELSMHKGRIISQEKLKKNDNDIKRELALLKINPAKVDLGQNNTFNMIGSPEEMLDLAMQQMEKMASGRIVEEPVKVDEPVVEEVALKALPEPTPVPLADAWSV